MVSPLFKFFHLWIKKHQSKSIINPRATIVSTIEELSPVPIPPHSTPIPTTAPTPPLIVISTTSSQDVPPTPQYQEYLSINMPQEPSKPTPAEFGNSSMAPAKMLTHLATPSIPFLDGAPPVLIPLSDPTMESASHPQLPFPVPMGSIRSTAHASRIPARLQMLLGNALHAFQ